MTPLSSPGPAGPIPIAIEARAVVARSPGAPVAVENIVVDPPGPGEVRVRLLASGVCHSDLHARNGDFGAEFPYLLGHEATGVIELAGEGVARPAVGEVVGLTWRAPCGACRPCVAGRPAFCAKPVTAAPRMRTAEGRALGRVLGLGTFATHTVVAAPQAIPVAPDLAAESTCLIGCCVATGVGAALYAGEVRPGASVAVFGCGAVGISVIQGARLAHATRIVAVDIAETKLEWARRFGATDVVVARAGDPAKAVRALSGGGVDVAFEAVGLPDTLAQALAATGLGGTTVLIGVPAPKTTLALPMSRFFHGRGNLRATFYGDCLPARDFPLLEGLYRRGALDLDGLVTRRIALDDVEEAFAAMQRGETLRSVIVFPR
jgi:S-(hydroxymethyl)mycothiol dehydrogenase